MASVFALLEAFKRKEAAALGFFPCATASFITVVKAIISRMTKRSKLVVSSFLCCKLLPMNRSIPFGL